MDYKVYAIKSSKNGRIYVGMSQNPEQRIKEHNSGHVFSTKGYKPWDLIYVENCGCDRKVARQREKYFKSGVGKEFLKNVKCSQLFPGSSVGRAGGC